MPQIRSGTLVANTVATVTFTQDWNSVEVINRNGVAEIWFRTDGVNPTVGGNDCEVLPASISSALVEATGGGVTEVRLISTGTPTYTVRGS